WVSSSSTRNIAFGSVSRTFAMTSIASSFAIQTRIRLCWQTSNTNTQLKQMPSRGEGSRRSYQFFDCRPDARENFRPLLSDRNRVLEMRTGLTIDGHDGPA